jgi:hypothetical protein
MKLQGRTGIQISDTSAVITLKNDMLSNWTVPCCAARIIVQRIVSKG